MHELVLDAMVQLARTRPAFHSEDDFKLALAVQLALANEDLSVRCESRFRRPENWRMDILLTQACGRSHGIELKYLTDQRELELAGEHYSLLDQGSNQQKRYSVVKDFARMEWFTRNTPNSTASVVLLTNKPAFWRAARGQGAAFCIREGAILNGMMDWDAGTKPGTKGKGNDAPIELQGRYQLVWSNYGRDRELGFRYTNARVPAILDE